MDRMFTTYLMIETQKYRCTDFLWKSQHLEKR